MSERIISINVEWSEPDAQTGTRTFLGVRPLTRNDDGSDPESVFVPAANLNPQIVSAFTTNTFPALIAARAAVIAARMSPQQLAAKQAEDAENARAQAQAAADALEQQIAAKQALIASLDQQISEKQAQVEG